VIANPLGLGVGMRLHGILRFSFPSPMIRVNERIVDFKVGNTNSIQSSVRDNVNWISDVF
jgi:hypothetical protein